MKLLQRLQLAGAALFNPQAIYEAGRMYDPRRSRIPGWVRDARFDADAMSRLEILRKARYFERNSAIVNRLADLFEEYTVGPNGLRFVPASSDTDWNKKFARWFEEWQKLCDISSLAHFGTVQSLCARSWFIDGEVLILKTRGRIRGDQRSYPRIQIVEAHRLETPGDVQSDANVSDGILMDSNGRPIRYFIRDNTNDLFDARYREYQADDVIHLFEPTRPGMLRGLSFLYPVLNDLHDLDDLQMLNMDTAKEAAAVTAVIKTKTGELTSREWRAQRFNVGGALSSATGTSGGSSQTRTAYYNEVFRGKAQVLQKDDDYAQHQVTRPSESERYQWSYLTSKVCIGSGISKMLVFPESIQGTVTRADLDVQGAFFRSRSAVLASVFSRVYEFAAKWAVNNERELSDPPADYLRVKVRPPRSVNVDVGRNSNALVQEYEAGFRTLEQICGELGEDYVEVLEQRGVELAIARRVEQEQGLPEGSLIKFTLEMAKQKMQQEQKAKQLEERMAA